MSRSQAELDGDLQRHAAVEQQHKPSNPLTWLLLALLLAALVAGVWWFGKSRSNDVAPVAETTTQAAPAADTTASTAAKPSKATSQRDASAKRKTPVIADRSAALMADTPKPKYPPSALRANVGGTVTLDVQVDPTGEPSQISIAKRSGNRDLDRAALTAASHWHFKPAMHHGKAVASAVQVPVEFSPQ